MNNCLKEWAKREMDRATKDLKMEEKKYYDAAYQVFCDFVDRTEKLENPGVVKTLFMQLLNDNPLTPIEDNEEDWVISDGYDPEKKNVNPGYTSYQCRRKGSFFKKVIYDKKTGEISSTKFTDADRSVCIDINTKEMFCGGIGPAILDEMIPIRMPYQPLGKIKIFTEEFKYHEDCDGTSDTFGVLYFRMEDSQMKNVMRFFKEDHKTREMVEINKTEYFARKAKVEKREAKCNG